MSNFPTPDTEQALNFGSFRLLAKQKQLFQNDKAVRLGGRALDLLVTLVGRAGEVVSRPELESCVWPKTLVEETSLRVHISALRKALGDGMNGARYITNVPGHGYCFVAPVTATAQPSEMKPPQATVPALQKIVSNCTRLIGRDSALQSVIAMLANQRFVTVTGAGGIGKTSLAQAVADEVGSTYREGVRFVDLAPMVDPVLLPGTVALGLGISVAASHDSSAALAAFLAHSNSLLVLDNCEHVVEAVAVLVETLLAAAPGLSILATSREPLQASCEWVYRLPALDLPPATGMLTLSQAMEFSAVQLFVQRASASSEAFELTEALAPALCEVCQRLDGIPLAIELAAARVSALGLAGLASHIDDHFLMLTRGRRTAMPRHQTLRALVEWSYALLPEREKTMLHRLSAYKAGFTLESAEALAPDSQSDDDEFTDLVLNLASKSLLAVEVGDHGIRYRMLETTRAYALQKLLEGPEARTVRKRHAMRMVKMMKETESAWDAMTRSQWMATYAYLMDDVRAALDWSFSADGDSAIGVTLIALAVLPIHEIGVLNDFLGWIQTALDEIHHLPDSQPLMELRLNAALSFSSGNSQQPTDPAARFLHRTLELADELDQPQYRIAAHYSAWMAALGTGNYIAAYSAAQQVLALADRSHDKFATLLGNRISAHALHFTGQHAAAERLAQEVLRHVSIPMPLAYNSPVPRHISVGILQSRMQWLRGYVDQASAMAQAYVAQAEDAHPAALMQAMGLAACPIALWRGDNAIAEVMAERLLVLARRHSSGYWVSWAQGYLAVLNLRKSLADPIAPSPYPLLDNLHPNVLECIATTEAQFADDDSLARAENGSAGWCAPEILRVHGDRLFRQGNLSAATVAESFFTRSLELARQQGALSWELRTSCSIAQLWSTQYRAEDAHHLISGCISRFSEGFDTKDLTTARSLLETISAGVQLPHSLRA